MRDLVRQIVEGYRSLKLEGQDEGYVLFSGQDPDNRESVLIKILPRLLGQDPAIAQRFQGLARAIRQLNHPNIVSVRKVGEEAGLPYLVTRALEKAQPLATRLDQPWAVDAAADVAMQVGAALEHAYDKGVVHGHLTPEDIVIEDNGRALVSNLGLDELFNLVGARVKETASPFLPPERSAGQAPEPSADVYSLAAILYALLAHRPPQVIAGQVQPPSRFNPDVPEAMDQVVVRALAPNPDDRYPDIHSFAAALGSVSLEPTERKPVPTTPGERCPRCGATGQTGRFCRKCGTALTQRKEPESSERVPPEKSVLDEPIQITRIDVGSIEVGTGIEAEHTVIAQPMSVATGDVAAEFPDLLPMPDLDLEALWPDQGEQPVLTMPQPPEMPTIDWAEVAPPMPPVPTIEDIAIERESHREND
ncbi:MAG: protein kinase [Anaerolineae bacterium]